MLQTDLLDHRRTAEPELLAALAARDALALAEVCHRTLPAAHSCARRLLTGTAAVEALLRTLYLELWTDPPAPDAGLERWIRQRAFAIATADLRERGAAPAVPSVVALLSDLPAPETRYLDAAERTLAELPDDERLAVLRAHDAGIPSTEQDVRGAAEALERALIALAGPTEADPTDAPRDLGPLGDWVLGLVSPQMARALDDAVSSDADVGAYARFIRRGRRRLEGLPPTPDLAQRVLATALAGMAPGPVGAAPAPAAPPAAAAAQPAVVPAASALDEHEAEADRDQEHDPEQDDPRLSDLLREDEDEDDEGEVRPGRPDETPQSWDDILGHDDTADLTVYQDDVQPELGEDIEPLPRRSLGRRLLRWIGMLLVLAAGAALGLFLATNVLPLITSVELNG